MTTEKKSEETTSESKTSDNKAIFGPLGNYAVVAVIMVSIIVTTAIMLDKQLNSVDEKLAAIENEVAQMTATAPETMTEAPETMTETVTETTVAAEIIEATPAVSTAFEAELKETTEVATTAPAEVQATIEIQSAEVQEAEVRSTEVQIAEKPSAEVLVAKETSATTISANDGQQANSAPAQFEMATAGTSIKARRAQFEKENQARIDAFKLEQKQHTAELFARIKILEAKQLDRYKASQDKQVAYLRDQLVRQQQVIDALITRNKETLEMREASVQKSQSNREQVLNRI